MATTDVKATNINAEDRSFLEKNKEGLSDSTLRAKWINEPGEGPDHDGQTLATRSPKVIRAWAEERGGKPATVPGSEHDGLPGVLRFDFGNQDSNLEEIGWDTLAEVVKKRTLVFIFQQTMKDGTQSNFFRFDNPNREDG